MTMALLEDADDRTLRAVARENVRQNGLVSTLMGLQVMGSTGMTVEHGISLMHGVAEQMVRDEKKELRDG